MKRLMNIRGPMAEERTARPRIIQKEKQMAVKVVLKQHKEVIFRGMFCVSLPGANETV